MKLLNRLTIKHLLQNKKRTIVTIIGITLSTSLMVGIGLLLSSFLNSSREIAIENNGSHHVEIANITTQEKEVLESNVSFLKTYSYGTIGFAKINSKNEWKPYLYVVSGNDEFFNTEDLLEGRFPLNNEEIVIPKSLLEEDNGGASFQIGDEITLEIGYRKIDQEQIYDNTIALAINGENEAIETIVPTIKKKYTIVGIIKRSLKEDYQAPGFMAYTTKEDIQNIQSYHLYGTYKNVHKTYENTEEICNQLNENAQCQTNDAILYFYGVSHYQNLTSTLAWTFVIILSLLSIGCIIVIYNSFAISTMERKKSFGLYISLGATPKQIKYTVFFEAFVVGLIGIILGILGAFLGIYIVIQILEYLIGETYGLHLTFCIEPLFLYIPIIFMILVVFLSSYLPALKSSKITAIELIRENDDIKIPRKKVKTPKWIRSLFGMEGEIALKNMKRNKSKYRITILSLFISIVLFLSFSTYLKLGLNIVETNELPNYDIYASTAEKSYAQELKTLENVKESYIVNDTATNIEIPQELIQKEYFQYKQQDNHLRFYIITLEDDMYNTLKQEAEVTDNTYLVYNEGIYTTYIEKERKTYITPFFNHLNEITLCEKDCETIPITLFTKKGSILNNIILMPEMPTLFLPESASNRLIGMTDSYKITLVSKNNYKELLNEMDTLYKDSNKIHYYSPKKEYQDALNTALAIKILFYGFITLVALTGITSVFNTIHTSIHLRRKEFAMLRSIGLSPKGFNRMIFFESFFFGIKSLLYALPVSFGLIILINKVLYISYYFNKLVIPWESIFLTIFLVFFLVLLMMTYSVHKIKKENILESLKEENI